jgi:glycosyltransferase involved in cell wall biosynthesis
VRFGYLGHLAAAKGVRTLLAALAALPRGIAELLVAGDGDLSREVDRASSDGVVRFLGWVSGEAREAFFRAVDCLVVPSEVPEAAGLVVAEARQRGLPVIASDIGGLPEYLDPASRPLLFPPGDVAALARSLARLIESPRGYLPTGGPSTTWAEHVGDVLRLYERACARRASRS